MAKAYKDGAGWAFRLRVKGQDIFRAGFSSKKAAQKEADALAVELDQADKPALLGPQQTPVAQALFDYALEVLPTHKGADQEVRRINRYLRALALPILRLEPIEAAPESVKASMRAQPRKERAVHFRIWLDAEQERAIPNGLHAHRAKLAAEGLGSDTLRSLLARTMVADVSAYQLQKFVNQLEAEDNGMSTVKLEVAILRQMLNHARRVWCWSRPHSNPASGLTIQSQDTHEGPLAYAAVC